MESPKMGFHSKSLGTKGFRRVSHVQEQKTCIERPSKPSGMRPGSFADDELLVGRHRQVWDGRKSIQFMKMLSIALSCVLLVEITIPPAFAQSPPSQLQIVVVEGEGAIHHVGQTSGQSTLVRIADEAGKPVAGASVVFNLPTAGPGGEFSNGSKTLIVSTDARGEAAVRGLRVNRTPGKLQIHVNASYRGRTARTNITQFVMEVPGSRAGGGSGKTILVLLAIAGAAAGGGAYAITRKGNGGPAAAPAATPIGITPGTGTAGPPR
jgi:hypothetical protein